MLADIVSLVRHAIGATGELAPFEDRVRQRFEGWTAMQETAGRDFTPEQRRWLEAIRDHIAGSVSMDDQRLPVRPLQPAGRPRPPLTSCSVTTSRRLSKS